MKQKIVKIFVTCYFLCSVCSYAQLQREWVQFYQELNGGEGYALCPDDSGNVYVTGIVGTNDTDGYCTIKYSSSGVQQWARNYRGTNNYAAIPRSIAIDGHSNIYVTGSKTWCGLPFTLCNEYYTIEYSSQGIQQWIAEYRGIASPYADNDARKIAVDNGGNIYVTGICDIAESVVLTTIKYSTNGDSIWVKRGESVVIGQLGYSDIKMEIDLYNNIIIVYTSHSNINMATTICYDSSGNLRWRQIYDSSTSGGTAVAIDKDNNIYTGGWTWNSVGGIDYLLIKYSSNGLHLWHRKYHFGKGFGVKRGQCALVHSSAQ